MQTINCPTCQAVIVAPEVQVDILNGLLNSMMNYHHASGLDCAACGAYLLPFISEVTVNIGWKLIEKPKEAPRIIAPGRATFPQ